MPRNLIAHRPLSYHGSTWPGGDHATFRGMGRHYFSSFPDFPTSAFFLLDLLLQLLLLLLSWSTPGHAARLQIPLPLRTVGVAAVILPPRGFSCCCKLLPKTMLPSEDFRLLHCPRLCSRRRTILVVVSPVAVPLPKTGPDGAHDYIRTGTAPSASASASQAGPRCAQRWRERVVRCFQIWMP